MTERIAELIARNFPASGGELSVDRVPIRDLADRFGTPLFVYAGSVIDRQWSRLRQALPENFRVYYSVKANPTRAIVSHLLRKGAGLEIASAGEFHQALQAGCPPACMLFAGPGKTDAELELVLKQQIGEIHLESLAEADRVNHIAGRLDVRARASIRINPGGEAQGGAMRMGGKPAAFGIDEERLEEAVAAVAKLSSIDFQGVHLFTGTQILDAEVLTRQYRKGLEIAKRAAKRSGRPIHTVDFGGGLGIPYFAHEQALNLDAVRHLVAELMAEYAADPIFASTTFIVEPGRFLIGEAGVYVTRVIDVKVSRGKKFIILDGGMHHHLAASGNLGQTIKRNFPMAFLTRLGEPAVESADVCGPLCTPLDTLARDLSVPEVRIGDLVGVLQSGAYARSASPMGFLSHPTPAEVLVEDGQARMIRRRGTYEDMCADLVA
jgi:diaminopimelate decarboxylase